MPAVTSIIAAAGAAASAGQAIAANQRRKKDEAAAKEAASRLSGLKETDYSAGLQVPTMGYDLAQQGIQQQEASGIQALKESGAAGVIGGIPSMNQATNEAQLQLAADLNQAEYNRDLYRSQNRQGIEGRKMERQYDIGMGQVMGSQLASLQDRQLVNQGVEGAFSGLTSLGESIATNQALYKNQPKAETPIDTRNGFATPTSSLLKKKGTPMINTYGPAPDLGTAPVGTNTFGNASYAPGYTPYGYYPGLTTPFKR